MKIASFNIENIFQRQTELIKKYRKSKLPDWEEELNSLMARELKSTSEMERIKELIGFLNINSQSNATRFELKRFDTEFKIRLNSYDYLPKASDQTHWEGWMPLASQPISNQAIFHKAKVIADINPDILFLQEVESRNALLEFHDSYLKKEFKLHFEEVYFSPTNDTYDRGFGLLLKPGYKVDSTKSHCNQKTHNGKPLFDFDLLEILIDLPNQQKLLCLHTHFSEDNSNKTAAQAKYLTEIYHKRKVFFVNIIVLGCLQLPSFSKELSPLFKELKLLAVSRHKQFSVIPDFGNDASYYRLGGYAKGVNIKQQDYILLPRHLYAKITHCGLNRQALRPEKPPQWLLYSTVKKQSQAASGHPLLWVGFDKKRPSKKI
jgi:hypothetical protein